MTSIIRHSALGPVTVEVREPLIAHLLDPDDPNGERLQVRLPIGRHRGYYQKSGIDASEWIVISLRNPDAGGRNLLLGLPTEKWIDRAIKDDRLKIVDPE